MGRKQWMAGAVSLVLLLGLSACGEAPAPAPEPEQPAQNQSQEHQPAQERPQGDQTIAPQKPLSADPSELPAPVQIPVDPEEAATSAPVSAVVPASAPVPALWFSDAAFVGDSVSVMLEMYNNTSGKLGDPAFLCSVSLSQNNALGYPTGHERLPEYPKGSGQHPRLEDGVAASGAKKVYIMLGMNCIAGGVDSACQDLIKLVHEIQAKSPEAAILIQSVTPMTADSRRTDDALNNTTIQEYNQKMEAICLENHWYFVNVSEAVSDENGFLRADYSGDKAMGIHFNYNGAAAWTEYLLTHVPEALK